MDHSTRMAEGENKNEREDWNSWLTRTKRWRVTLWIDRNTEGCLGLSVWCLGPAPRITGCKVDYDGGGGGGDDSELWESSFELSRFEQLLLFNCLSFH